MKKLYKILNIFAIILTIVTFTYNVSAMNPWDMAQAFLKDGAQEIGFFEEGKQVEKLIKIDFGQKEMMEIIDFLWGIGLLVIFITTIIVGIKYMTALPEEKSRAKQALTPYVIGTVIIFGALTIWKALIAILESLV